MYSLPVRAYWFDDGHVNLTLQAILDFVVDDLNKLATDGLEHNGQALLMQTWSFFVRGKLNLLRLFIILPYDYMYIHISIYIWGVWPT